eukprot:CAMPEP_0118657840 /NCGR_PEP_ID=MMETSP0785-20121206/14241_1 /TAXON_ID=91992 /ORGANISM="Bolidomonas pacifica, Strain CCMP 1866" /LENGTH=281 /DNA_ID=CAMNT_0006550801 /DNA_START=73 /DNA_END=915 /DNA_ORIENTATION=+
MSSKGSPKEDMSPKQDSGDDSSESSDDEMVLAQNAGWDESDSDDEEEEGVKKSSTATTTASSSSSSKRKESQSNNVTAEFTLEEMGPPFFWAIRNMVGNSALYASKASEIADCVVDQVSVGTVVTQPLEEEEEPKKKKAKKGKKGGDGKTVAATDTTSYPIQMETDPRNRCIYAFATILNVNDEETTKFVPGILNKVKTAGGKEVEKFLAVEKGKGGNEVGLLISDAMVNVPHTIVGNLFDCLIEDVEWARENATGENGKEKLLYRFSKVLIIARVDGEVE